MTIRVPITGDPVVDKAAVRAVVAAHQAKQKVAPLMDQARQKLSQLVNQVQNRVVGLSARARRRAKRLKQSVIDLIPLPPF